MHRLASRSALWLLLGFVLGGIAAPVWHAGQHAAANHADAPSEGPVLTSEAGSAHAFDCTLCAVPHPPALATATPVLHAPQASESAWHAAPRGAGASAPSAYDSRGPPAC